jgi:hypothetical protein
VVPKLGTEPRGPEDAAAVIRARTFAALRVALRALEFADPVSEVSFDPHAWAHVGGELRYLDIEVMHTAVMRLAGVTWEALAEKQEVLRQAVHRRLKTKVEKETELAIVSDHRKEINDLIGAAIVRLTNLREVFEEDCTIAANGVIARSKNPHWWEA